MVLVILLRLICLIQIIYFKKTKPDTYTQTEKTLFDWTVEKNCLIPYRMLKFHVSCGMIVDRVQHIISIKQSTRLEKKTFNMQKKQFSKK